MDTEKTQGGIMHSVHQRGEKGKGYGGRDRGITNLLGNKKREGAREQTRRREEDEKEHFT